MSEGKVNKPFKVQEEWDVNQASAMEDLLNELVARQVVKKTGTYQGTGALNQVAVDGLPNPPLLLAVQKNDGAAPHIALLPLATGANVLAWTKKSFTLAAGSGFNTAGASYLYLVIA